MSLYNEMLEAAAVALHQHGDLNYLNQTRQTDNWRDCPRADAHEGAGKRVVDAILDAMDASAKQVRAEAKAAAARILAAREVSG